MCKSIIDCEPREEAAYVRKLMKDAGLNYSLHYSYEDICEKFRAELLDAPDRPDDGVIAACVFVYCLTRFPDEISSCGLPRDQHGDFSEQDINNNIQAVSHLLCRFISVTDDIAVWYRTIHRLLDIYFYNMLSDESQAFFVIEVPKSLQNCFVLVCDLLADLSEQDYISYRSRSSESASQYYDFFEAYPFRQYKTVISLVIFHALLCGFYQKRTPEKFKDMLMKCAMLGLTIENIFSGDIANILTTVGLAVPDNIERFYCHVYKNILNSEYGFDEGLFGRLSMINR